MGIERALDRICRKRRKKETYNVNANVACTIEDLHYWRSVCAVPDSLPQEVSEYWEQWVASPVVTHNLSPRKARALLEVFGLLSDRGIDLSEALFTEAFNILGHEEVIRNG